MVAEVMNSDELKSTLESAGNTLVVVDFYAAWCGPCKMIAPKVEELSKEMTDVIFLKVDIDELPDIAAQYEIISMPTFVFIKAGKVVDSFPGAKLEKLKQTIEQYK